MNEWGIGIKAAQLTLSIVLALCGGLALYVKLSMKSQLADFLEKLTVTLDSTFVRKEVFVAAGREQALNARLVALELLSRQTGVPTAAAQPGKYESAA